MNGVPDLMDGGGRLRRIVISLAIGVACAAIAYFVVHAWVDPDHEAQTAYVSRRQMDGGTFVLWVTLVTFAVTMSAALGVLNGIAKKKWVESQMPKSGGD